MENMIDLTPILQAVIALAAALITAYVIPWIRSKTTFEQRELLLSVISSLVYAAEQIYGAGNGEKKLAYVIAELEGRGMTVDVAAIEAIVKEQYAMLHKQTKPEPPDGGE